jgi:hypothetical protein
MAEEQEASTVEEQATSEHEAGRNDARTPTNRCRFTAITSASGTPHGQGRRRDDTVACGFDLDRG